MDLNQSQSALDELIRKVVNAESDLRDSLATVDYEGTELNDEIGKHIDFVWEVARQDLNSLKAGLAERARIYDVVTKAIGSRPDSSNKKAAGAPNWMTAIFSIGVIAWFILFVVVLTQGWNTPAAWTFAHWTNVLGALGLLAGWGVFLYLTDRSRKRSHQVQQVELDRQVAAWTAQRDEAFARYGVQSLESELAGASATVERLLTERVKQAIVAAINRRLEPSYASRLTITRPRGFGEIYDKRFTIQTPARKRLQFMLSNMPGGSIGIAGSRGAGKTTLLKLFCGPQRVIDVLNQKKVLGVLVSAPVAYQAREFILYLFSTVCQNVIKEEGGEYKFSGSITDAPAVRFQDSHLYTVLRPFPTLLVRIGLLLGVAGVALATAKALVAARVSPAAGSDAAAEATIRSIKSAASAIGSWLTLLDISPAGLFRWGLLLTVTGLLIAVGLRLRPGRTLMMSITLLADHAAALVRFSALRKRTLHWVASQENEIAFGELFVEENDRATLTKLARPESPPSELREEAENWLKTIKFQQSFTSGWSGALKLPLGVEGGVTRAATLAQNQLSLPEVVYFLTEFLARISRDYQVIIGIDEMDKLASDDLAQQFLNDIKSVFGLERCFYLISVSENAISNFERRGLPFRDVFDSAFDDFVYVDHLDFATARVLLEQRVVGRPIPFFGLSYCMSGGLARDLIRSFRAVLEAYEREPDRNSLADIQRTVVDADLRAKLRATRTAAKKIKQDPETELFLKTVHDVEDYIGDDTALAGFTTALLDFAPRGQPSVVLPRRSWQSSSSKPVSPPKVEDKEREGRLAELRALGEELGTYLCFAMTLREFFNDQLAESAITHPPPSGSLDQLARARQLIGVNPRIARVLLASFRESHGLASFP